MRNPIDHLIQYLVPLSFLAIWAITSLLNRETKPTPARRPISRTPTPRPGDPTLRWGPQGSRPASGLSSSLGREDDIVILDADDQRLIRPSRTRPLQQSSTRRTARAKPAPRKPTPTGPTLVSGVNQGVNQQLATSIDLAPLGGIVQGLAAAPAARVTPATPAAAPSDIPGVKIAAALTDPTRVREAFLLTEILGPPVALRPRAARRG